jgi:hypothetical protein
LQDPEKQLSHVHAKTKAVSPLRFTVRIVGRYPLKAGYRIPKKRLVAPSHL